MTGNTESVPAIGTLDQKDGVISDRALVLALDFLCPQDGNPVQAHTPGELLEVAALIEGYLTGAYRVDFMSSVPSHESGFALFGQVRAVLGAPERDALHEALEAKTKLLNQANSEIEALNSLLKLTEERFEKEEIARAMTEDKLRREIGQKEQAENRLRKFKSLLKDKALEAKKLKFRNWWLDVIVWVMCIFISGCGILEIIYR